MCGIHGFCWPDPDYRAVERMVALAAHRGPDGGGVWGDEDVTLGHNLLAVADVPPLSRQPWVRDRGVLVYNGEVYNHQELRDELAVPFDTDSDTEVLIAGLQAKGPRFLEEVDGMFALAYYDRPNKTLLLARDGNGAKPLYYGRLRGRLAFSSEVRSLLDLGFARRVSREAFKHYYYSGLVAGPLTLFDGVRKLVPGEVVQYHLPTGAEHRFNLNDKAVTPYAGSAADLPALVKDRLKEAVRLTLTGRRQVGVFLSGGLDSSSVLYEATQSHRAAVQTFTTRFALPHKKATHNQDADVARDMAKACGTRHREVMVGEAEWVADFENAVRALEEPRQGKSYSAYYATYRRAREAGVTVTLSGDGGDELLMGYKHHLDGQPFAAKLAALRLGHRPLPDPALAFPAEEQTAYLRGWLPPGGLTGDAVNDFMYTECLHTLSEDFLIRNDKLGSAFGLEARFPMMCGVFRDFARGVPSRMKAGPPLHDKAPWDWNNKVLLRRAYDRWLPGYVTRRGKTGWRAPTDGWVVGTAAAPAPDRGVVREYLRELPRPPLIRELFGLTEADVEGRYLNNREHAGAPKPSGKKGPGPGLQAQKELFTVATFSAWLRIFGMGVW